MNGLERYSTLEYKANIIYFIPNHFITNPLYSTINIKSKTAVGKIVISSFVILTQFKSCYCTTNNNYYFLRMTSKRHYKYQTVFVLLKGLAYYTYLKQAKKLVVRYNL